MSLPLPTPGEPDARPAPPSGGGADDALAARPAWPGSPALWILAGVALLGVAYFGRLLLLPLLLAFLLHFVLMPIVRLLHRARVPPLLSAALVVSAMVGGVAYGVYGLSGPVQKWAVELTGNIRQIERKLHDFKGPMEEMTRASKSVESLADVDGEEDPVVQVRGPGMISSLFSSLWEFLVIGSLCAVLLFFLLSSEDGLLRKVVRVLPRLRDKKVAVEVFRNIQTQISHYLLTVTGINIGLGIAMGVAMKLAGLPNPVLWGSMAAVLNFVPYLGATVGIGVVALASVLTFDTAGRAAIPPLLYFVINFVEGMVVTPAILGRRLTMGPIVLLLWLLLWGLLWGIPGALIAVPLLVTIKILCENLPSLSPVNDLLSR
jgi:predicted PurR-regulated permease PerM